MPQGGVFFDLQPMIDSHTPTEEPAIGASRAAAGDDLLPPVEPPSAGFIIQLFVVPALIVLVIVSVWFTFSWLVRIGRASCRERV